VERERKIIFLSFSTKYPKFKDGIFMKRFSFCVFALLALIGFVGATTATAATDTLTVIFDAPPEFDSTKGSVSIAAPEAVLSQSAMAGPILTAAAPDVIFDDGGELDSDPTNIEASAPASIPQTSAAPSDPNTVPEPATLVLLGLGILGILGIVRKKK
jgi:hypothetical protein